MGEGQPLLELGVTPDCIWGDENETTVYAQVLGRGKALIFRFYLDPNNPPHSLSSRIVSCYDNLDVSNKEYTFQDLRAMRSAIWSTLATIWPSCIVETTIFEPDTVIDVNSDETGGIKWLAYREPLYARYLELLRHIHPSDLVPKDFTPHVVDISEIIVLEPMGGRGCCKRVRIQAGPGEPSTYVFKGIDFQTYLQLHDDDDEYARSMVETWRRSSKLIAEIPPHPNIQLPPKMLVSARSSEHDSILVGHLSIFLPRGDLRTVITAANDIGTRISLQKKAKWCHQMSLAIAHTHRVMRNFHMDIKPGNFLVSDEDGLVLIDWEQSGAPASTLAPEADGTWDVTEQETDGGKRATKLVYTKYTGPERRNMPEGGGQQTFNIWNVFPEWRASCPKALELAEVFALGRSM